MPYLGGNSEDKVSRDVAYIVVKLNEKAVIF